MYDLTEKYVGKVKGVNPNLSFLEHEIPHYKFLSFPGGTRSGKTYSIIQWIWYNMERYSGVQYSVVRKTLKALEPTALKDFVDIGTNLGLYTTKNHNLTRQIYYHNGNTVRFLGADDHEKLRGAKQHVLYMNEAPELSWEVVKQLLFRTESRILIDYNPSYPKSWVYDKIESRDTCARIVTTYKDNPHLSKEQLEELEWIRINEPETYKIYGLGQRGELKGQIYKNWQRIDALPEHLSSSWIIDFGFANDPCAITEIRKEKRNLYCRERVYKKGLDNLHIGIYLFLLGVKPNDFIIADSSEPKSISELRRGWKLDIGYLRERVAEMGVTLDEAELKRCNEVISKGFRVQGAIKGPDSVNMGIQKVKQFVVHFTADSTNAWDEYSQYVWMEDKDTLESLNTPVDAFNHIMDTVRYYAIYAEYYIKDK